MFNYKRLDQKVKEYGMSKAEASRRLGVHYQTVINWTTDSGIGPAAPDLIRFLRVLGHDDDDLRAEILPDWYSTNGS